ncbi:LIC10280 family protein [Antarcticimicrobium luteum]|uniref:Fibronectin-binding protein n=1 Tax=Antarcticimicrobium luteum TaxID=2547397 RepID=A0A4R5UWU5_9RHOB|nr:hypothetical protein [Antarcticimicrobium luteum]TDK43773.1 hypothetical protein E1832_15965 [Antarcticimicrobium luteum]
MRQAKWGRRAVMGGLVAGLAMLAPPLAAQSISGGYRAEGRNPDGSAYRGTVTIREEGGMVYVSWRVGNQSYNGTGTRNGDIIWVDWGSNYPVVYVRMPSGELHGTWGNGTALERLIP